MVKNFSISIKIICSLQASWQHLIKIPAAHLCFSKDPTEAEPALVPARSVSYALLEESTEVPQRLHADLLHLHTAEHKDPKVLCYKEDRSKIYHFPFY